MRRPHSQSGVTLIELLLVVAVIGLIVALGIQGLHIHSESLRVDKTALEMEQVLEAALAYHADNGTWPEKNSDGACDNPNVDFVDRYLPNGRTQSTFGGHYCWDQHPAVPLPGTQSSPKFWVAISVPSVHIAERIAANLPNAVTTNKPADPSINPTPCSSNRDCYVKAEIVSTSGSSPANSTLIKAIGYCDPGYFRARTERSIQLSSNKNIYCMKGQNVDSSTQETDQYVVQGPDLVCPSGYGNPKIYVVPSFLETPYFLHEAYNPILRFPIKTLSLQDKPIVDCDAVQPGSYRCSIALKATIYSNFITSVLERPSIGVGNQEPMSGSIGATYTVLCQK